MQAVNYRAVLFENTVTVKSPQQFPLNFENFVDKHYPGLINSIYPSGLPEDTNEYLENIISLLPDDWGEKWEDYELD